MKRIKGLRRFVFPVVLIGLGIVIGISMISSNRSTIQVHGDIGYTIPHIDLGHSADLRDLQVEIDEMMRELESELEVSLPKAPELQSSPPQTQIIIGDGERRSPASQVNVGRISVFMGIFGIAAIFIMAMMMFFSHSRSPRHTA